jgi:hypothetical protein
MNKFLASLVYLRVCLFIHDWFFEGDVQEGAKAKQRWTPLPMENPIKK